MVRRKRSAAAAMSGRQPNCFDHLAGQSSKTARTNFEGGQLGLERQCRRNAASSDGGTVTGDFGSLGTVESRLADINTLLWSLTLIQRRIRT